MTKQQAVTKQQAATAPRVTDEQERERQNALLVDRDSALDEAARVGNVADVKFLVRHGAPVDDALHLAATHGHLSVVEALIRAGADVNATDGEGDTALTRAATAGHLDVVTALLRAGANVNAKNVDGMTSLSCAAASGYIDAVTELIRHGADANTRDNFERTALAHAADSGYVDVVAALGQLGAKVNARDEVGRTALSFAAESGHVDVVAELVRLGADVNAKDESNNTALAFAAIEGHVDVVAALVRHGADVDVQDIFGRTALLRAAEAGHAEVVAEMLRHGADMNVKDNDSNTLLNSAIKRKHTAVVAVLLRHGVFDESSSPTDDEVSLFAAAAVGDLDVVQELVAKNVDIECTTRVGRTALFYAAEYGRLDVVTHLIECGANVAVKSHASPSQPHESETPLTLAGRAWHMKVWQDLIQAGAPVNVWSTIDGETPLISIARSDFFPAVQQLIARGGSGALCVEDARDDEYPLLPGSLATMSTLCATVTFEFEAVCSRLLTRLQDVCAQLQLQQRQRHEKPDATVTHDTLVTFASILFRACRLLFDIDKKATALARFVASRAILQRVHDIHEELNHFGVLHQLTQDASFASNKEQQLSSDEEDELQQRFEHALSTDDTLMDGFEVRGRDDNKHFSFPFLNDDVVKKVDTRFDMAVLLRYELAIRQEERNVGPQAIVSSVLQRFVQVCNMKKVPEVPVWFISPDDLDFHDWNLVQEMRNSAKHYAGKWRSTSVVIETSAMETDAFTKTAEQWHQLSHPNIVKLFGACHIGSDKLFVYEAVPDAKPLIEFLRDASNRQLMWQYLHQAAVGLQYLHDRGVAHGCLCTETIVVGSDGVVRLTNIGGQRQDLTSRAWYWQAPEDGIDFSRRSTQADIYAFGLCIWVARTGELTTRDVARFRHGKMPKRPSSMTGSAHNLVKRMCAEDPSQRVDVAFVVRRLKQFALENDQRTSGTNGVEIASALFGNAKSQSQRLDAYEFPDLGYHSIPNALAHIQKRCEDLPDTQWILESVLPALAFVFELLLEREKTPLDTTVGAFCAAVARLQRYVRTAVSNKSVYQQMRSRKVAESHHLVYTELDQLLDMLEVEATHSIRRWRYEAAPSIVNPVDLSDVVRGVPVEDGVTTTTTADTDTSKPSNSPSDAITLNHLETPPAVYEQWTRDGLLRASTGASTVAAAASSSSVPPSSASGTSLKRPSWYLSLKELSFDESSDQIGEGAFGAVYRGSWRGTPVVIKFMGYEEDIETISTDLLLHEVRVWHRLNHPHVLKLFGASHVDKRYFVCEFAGNGELRAYLKKMHTPGNDHLTWQKLHEAALGLQYLHAMSVAHNDLKCDNIMVGSDHKAKLIDFGLSCLIGEAEIQIASNKIGAVNWRSPEYLAGGRPSFASDVYSFAMCIIEAVSGEPPWGRNPVQAGQVRFWLRRGMSPPLPASMTPKQRNLIELMTKTDPSERVSMAFVVNKLEEIAQDASV